VDFLTSTVLAGIAWDGIKYAGNITSKYLKEKLGDWIVDDGKLEEIASKINDFPDAYKKNDKFLELAIQEDENLQELLKNIHPKTDVSFKDNVITGSTINNAIGGSTIHSPTTNYYYGPNQTPQKKTKTQVKSELDKLLAENAAVFKMYGPTPENTSDLTTRKHEAWRSMTLNFIVPNNDKIIGLLEENIDLLNLEEKIIFMEFKLHAEGFKDNQTRDERIAEYPKFPIAINTILGG
jgi:hypothetical protein